MSETATLNVQDWDNSISHRYMVVLPVSLILEDPDNPNPRGPVGETTDLQESMRAHGIREPLQVRPAPDKEGYYYRISGARRQAAARALDWKMVPAIVDEDVDPAEVRRLMMATEVRKEHPPIVLDKTGRVIGGLCLAVYEEIEAGRLRQDLAPAMGVTADLVGAYYQLYLEDSGLSRRVGDGDMSISAYSLVKHSPPEVRNYLAQKRGRISASYVRDTLRNWSKIQAKSGQPAEPIREEPAEKGPTLREPVGEALPLLNGALERVTQLVNQRIPIGPLETVVLDQLADKVMELKRNAH